MLDEIAEYVRFADDAVKFGGDRPVLLEGKTDQAGTASFELQIPPELSSPGVIRVLGKAAVFDESGRPVYQRALTVADPKPYYIGLRRRGPYYVSPGTPQTVQVVAVDPGDRPIRGFRARIELVRLEWHSVLRQHGSDRNLRYVSERREVPVTSQTLTLGDGPGEATYAAPRSGEYQVRVSRDGERGYSQLSFYAYSWGSTDITSFAVDPEARIEIVTDKQRYTPGEKARVLFQAPFSGRMLVTVERNGVLWQKFLQVAENAASVELPVEERWMPNVYISAPGPARAAVLPAARTTA